MEKTMKEYLQQDNQMAFNLAIYNRFNRIGDGVYSEICGGFIDGVCEWAEHNIDDVIECENSKYFGWTIFLGSGYQLVERKVYIARWVMETKPKNWKHAKNLFNKYLQQVPVYKN